MGKREWDWCKELRAQPDTTIVSDKKAKYKIKNRFANRPVCLAVWCAVSDIFFCCCCCFDMCVRRSSSHSASLSLSHTMRLTKQYANRMQTKSYITVRVYTQIWAKKKCEMDMVWRTVTTFSGSMKCLFIRWFWNRTRREKKNL